MLDQIRMLCAATCLFSLSGCASQPVVCPPPSRAQPESMVPVPEPGSFRKRLGKIVTSAPTSTGSPTTPTTSGTR